MTFRLHFSFHIKCHLTVVFLSEFQWALGFSQSVAPVRLARLTAAQPTRSPFHSSTCFSAHFRLAKLYWNIICIFYYTPCMWADARSSKTLCILISLCTLACVLYVSTCVFVGTQQWNVKLVRKIAQAAYQRNKLPDYIVINETWFLYICTLFSLKLV